VVVDFHIDDGLAGLAPVWKPAPTPGVVKRRPYMALNLPRGFLEHRSGGGAGAFPGLLVLVEGGVGGGA